MYQRCEYKIIKRRLEEPRRFIQVIMGPRQVGKSTVVKQVLKDTEGLHFFYSADNVAATDVDWISDCWRAARSLKKARGASECVLVIDEIQKIANWSEVIKKEWDKDSFDDENIKVLLLGSSRVLIEKGLSESLAGRFEEIRMTHWDYTEMRDAFGFSLDQYFFYGGYPGAAHLIDDYDRFSQYIQSSIIDSTINKDILMDSPVGKPALLRQAFELSSAYSGKILALNKMLGSLQDVGNTSTLASYLQLLNDSGLVGGLKKFSVDMARRKSSIPKFQVYNNALKTVYEPFDFETAILDGAKWGVIYESGIGAYLINQAFKYRLELYYWRDRNDEVDFVVRKNGKVAAIEIKSNQESNTSGLRKFREIYNPTTALVVGDGGMKTEDFLSTDIREFL